MKVFLFLLALFIAIPLIELGLLLLVGGYIGWWQTLAVVVVTGTIGAYLARKQGWQTWMRLRQSLSNREMPTDALLDGLMILMAGAFLITPGILTDCTGFAMLFPPFRKLLKRPLLFWINYQLLGRFNSVNPFSQSNISQTNFGSLKDITSVFQDATESDSPPSPQSDDIIDVPFTRKTTDD